MKFYRPLPCDNTVKNPQVCDFSNFEERGFSKTDLLKGQIIQVWDSEIFFQSKKKKNDGMSDDVLQNYLMLDIYSSKLSTLLIENNITGIQLLPIDVLTTSNASRAGFRIVNTLNLIEAFDFERSIFNRFDHNFPNPNVRGKIAGVTEFVLHSHRLTGFDIFRLKEYKQAIFVSEKFKDIFEKNICTGYSFTEVKLTYSN